MSSTALLQAMVDHIEEADDASAEEVLQIVCEVFIAVFRQPTTTRPSGPPLSVQFASREEPQLEAVQLALSLFHKANTAAPTLATLLRSAEHHATSALFLQDTLPIAFPSDASSRGSSSKEMQRTALSLVEVVGLTVGRASCQRLLPGVASAASKYLLAYLPRRGAHCQRRSSLCKAADILTFWIETCFGLPLSFHNDSKVASSSPQVSWSQQDQHWVSMAAPKLLPLLTRVLDANTIGDVAVGVPATIAQALLSLCGALFRATWHRGVCPAPTARSLVCSIVLLKCVMRGQDGGGGAFDVNSEPMEWHELSSLHTAEILHQSDSTTVAADLSTVASWDALMEFTCSPTQQFGSAYMSALTLMASLATSSSTLTSKSRGWRELLANNDGIFLWRLIRRAVRYCTDPHTSLAVDDFGLLQQTSQERRLRTASSQQTQHTTKSLMDLLDDLLSAIGKLATYGSGEILEGLLDHAEEVLQDWNAYAAHPEVIYVISRIAVFGALPRPTNSTSAIRTLQTFVQQQVFESLWELITLDHLWKIEISADQCTFQELQHRAIVASTILAAVRQTSESLGDVASSCVASASSSSQQRQCPSVILERFVVLCLYNAFEKESCPFGDVHEAASITVRALSELSSLGTDRSAENSPSNATSLGFFFQHCKTLTDEARRAVLDPELHAGAIKVVSGLVRYVTKSLGQPPATLSTTSAPLPSSSDTSSLPIVTESPCVVPDVHMRAITAFVQDTIEMLATSITEWRQRKASSAPIVGCLSVLQHAVSLVVMLTNASPRAYPSEEDWDDERRWTSTDPRIMALQELVWNTVFHQLHPMCMAPNTAIASRTVSITMLMLELFRSPPHVAAAPKGDHADGMKRNNTDGTNPIETTEHEAPSPETTATPAVHRCSIVRTHLNTLHRIYHAFEDLLVAGWKQRKEDALLVLNEARTLAVQPDDVDLKTMAPASKRTKRSTLLRSGRWLADITIPVELPEVLTALCTLAALAPAFLAPRIAEEAAPAVLLWYTRCQWMVNIPTRREEATRQASVVFLRAAVNSAHTAGFGEHVHAVMDRCRGTVIATHWPELYDETFLRSTGLPSKSGDNSDGLAELQAAADAIKAALSAAHQPLDNI